MDTRKFYFISFLGAIAVVFLIVATGKNSDTPDVPAAPASETSIRQEEKAIDGLSQASTSPVPLPDPDALLPDLEVKPLIDPYIVTNREGKKILRFPGTFANTGDGPLELTGTPDPKSGTTRAAQHLYKKDGTKDERFVGNFIFHTGHDHWHFEDFVEFELWSVKEDMALDQRLQTTGKMTFCLHDYASLPDTFPGKPERLVYPWCGSSADIQGISVGWVDTYLADVPGQEMDITDLPDGRYAFRSIVDPLGRVVEKNEDNNFSVSHLEITGDKVEILPDE